MKQITLYVYQTINGCPARADKQVDDAILKADCLLLDEETYLDVFMNHLGWPLTEKGTFVVAQADCNLTEKEGVQFITGDAVAELSRMKAAGDGTMVAYGEGIAAVLLNSGLADEIVVVTLPKVTKRLCGILRGTVRCGWYGLARCWTARRYGRCTEGCNLCDSVA